MKKFSLILNIVLVIAVAALFFLHFAGGNKNDSTRTSNSGDSTAIFSGNTRVAYIQIDTLLNNMLMYKDLSDKLAGKQQQLEASFATKYKAFEKEVVDFQTKVQKGLLTRLEMQEVDQQLGNKRLELENQRNEYLVQLQEENGVAQNQVIDYIMKYLEEHNSGVDYDYVFSYSFGGGLLFANKSLDITGEVLAGINAKYEAEKKASDKKK